MARREMMNKLLRGEAKNMGTERDAEKLFFLSFLSFLGTDIT